MLDINIELATIMLLFQDSDLTVNCFLEFEIIFLENDPIQRCTFQFATIMLLVPS